MTFPRSMLMFFLWVALPSLILGQDWTHQVKNHYRQEEGCINLYDDSAGRIMQIILIRHGEPDLDKKGWRKRDGAIRFIQDYDSAGVVPFATHPVCNASVKAGAIVHSTLPRARETAELAFGGSFTLEGREQFVEFGRKVMKFCNVSMPLKCWTTTSRLLWFMGMNDRDIESFRQARARARENAAFLTGRAEKDQQVILVAHGLHNRYVRKYLKNLGWKVMYNGGKGYLSVQVLVRERR